MIPCIFTQSRSEKIQSCVVTWTAYVKSSLRWQSWLEEERKNLKSLLHYLINNVRRLVDKTATVRRHCATRKSYGNGNTSSMATHLKWHQPLCFRSGTGSPQLITAAPKQPFDAESDGSKAITKSIEMFIAADRQFSVNETSGQDHTTG